MDNFWILILVSFFATISLDKNESVQLEELEELPLQTFDEIFGEGWWDNDKAEEWHKLTLEHNFLHQIDRQNTQLGQIEPNSTDQLGQIEPTSTDQLGQIEPNSIDQLGQIEPNSTDQNSPFTESDHSDNAKNGEEQNEMSSNKNIAEDEQKCKIIEEFHAMKDKFKQKGKYSNKEWVKIEDKIAKHLKVYRTKIYEWKKEFGLSRKMHNFGKEKEDHKHLIEKFDQMKAELKRAGLKNSYDQKIDKTAAKELGLSFQTIYKWKRQLGQTEPNKYLQSEQKELMKSYYEIKTQTLKISDKDIAKMLNIGSATLFNWKKQFKRQKLQPNSVDGHSVEENAGSNVQEINKSNEGII